MSHFMIAGRVEGMNRQLIKRTAAPRGTIQTRTIQTTRAARAASL
jgi:hypothetical protein